MNIKSPACYDVSNWQGSINWANVSPHPLLVICKATEGNFYSDPTFKNNMASLLANGIRRGVYHFHRKANSPLQQANYFLNFVRGTLSPADLIVLDVEEGGETAAQLIAWLDLVEAEYPDNLIMIYSRKNILDPIVMTATQAARLRTYPTWLAGYLTSPDLYSAIPAGYVADPVKFGAPWLWQYASNGIVAGINGNTVDLNWIAPVYAAILGRVTPPPIDIAEHTTPYLGVDEYTEIVNGVKCHITLIDITTVKELRVVHFGGVTGLGYVSDSPAEISFNGEDYKDGLPNPQHPYSLSYVSGVQHSPQVDFRKWLNIKKDKTLQYDSNIKNLSMPWMVTSFVRPLVEGGIVNPTFSDPLRVENIEIHARSGFGYTANGRIIQIVCEGHVIPDKGIADRGVTLPQFGALCKKYGAYNMGEQGGGGDSGKKIKGVMVVTPSDPTERAIVQRIDIFLNDTNGGTSMNGTAQENLGNTVTKRDKASRYGASIGSVNKGATIEFVKVADVVVSGAADNPNDKWLFLPDGSYVNYILNGVLCFKILTQPSTPPTTITDGIEVKVTSGGVVTHTYTAPGPVIES